jgi:hypothetical protein
MDRASSLIYPGSKTVAGWWRQLAPRQPLAFAIGYGFLHRVEAPVHVLEEKAIEPLAHLVLQALALEDGAGARTAVLQERLRLPGPLIQRVLGGMSEEGLLSRVDSDGWQTTPRGRQALERRSFPVHVPKRCSFPFLERLDPAGIRLGPPHYLPIAECVHTVWSVDDAHRLDVGVIQGCLEKPADWRQACGFPLDAEALPEGGAIEAWRRVVVDRPERMMLALIAVNGEAGKEVLGFAVKVESWTLLDGAPALRAPAHGADLDGLFPELLQAPPMAVWQDAWRNWCKQRQLPANEVEICALAYHPPRLEVQAPPRLVQRLQAAKSDLFKGDAWILVGEGYVRTAVQLTSRQAS